MSGSDQEERELLEAFEAGELKRAPDAVETQRRHQEYAEAMLKKDARIRPAPGAISKTRTGR